MQKLITNKKIYIIVLIIILCLIFFINQNTNIVVSNVIYENEKIPISFNNFKICQITDLHDANFGENQSQLIEIVKEGNPDIIVITGDLIDASRYDLDSAGVIVLENAVEVLNKNNEQINLIEIKDYNFYLYDGTDAIPQELKDLVDENDFNILLSHRPELFDIYVEQNIDLVFTGHAHGGQFNIPFIGSIIAPDQGLFPEYTSGMYEEDDTSMYVSRGLGNSIIPLRIFNNPEVVFVTLKTI